MYSFHNWAVMKSGLSKNAHCNKKGVLFVCFKSKKGSLLWLKTGYQVLCNPTHSLSSRKQGNRAGKQILICFGFLKSRLMPQKQNLHSSKFIRLFSRSSAFYLAGLVNTKPRHGWGLWREQERHEYIHGWLFEMKASEVLTKHYCYFLNMQRSEAACEWLSLTVTLKGEELLELLRTGHALLDHFAGFDSWRLKTKLLRWVSRHSSAWKHTFHVSNKPSKILNMHVTQHRAIMCASTCDKSDLPCVVKSTRKISKIHLAAGCIAPRVLWGPSSLFFSDGTLSVQWKRGRSNVKWRKRGSLLWRRLFRFAGALLPGPIRTWLGSSLPYERKAPLWRSHPDSTRGGETRPDNWRIRGVIWLRGWREENSIPNMRSNVWHWGLKARVALTMLGLRKRQRLCKKKQNSYIQTCLHLFMAESDY